MTEIVNNNNGMAFDLLETGNSASTTSGHGEFSSFFSDIDNRENSEPQDGEITDSKLSSLEETMSEIISILKNSELNIDNNILSDIALKLKSFFGTFNSLENAGDTQTKNIQSNSGNDNFLHLMRFLDKIKSILSLSKNTDQSRNQEINRVLDQITPKLNEQIKAHIKRNTGLTIDDKVGMLNKKGVTVTQNSTVRPDETNVIKQSDLNLARTPINNTNAKASDNAEMTQVTQSADKVRSNKK